MDTNELFSFMDEQQPEEDEDSEGLEVAGDEVKVEMTKPVDNTRKRKVDSNEEDTSLNGVDHNGISDHHEENGLSPVAKKTRMASPAPVVVDEFETEAKREVAASAGLTGTVEAGSRLELRHQVRHQVAVPPGYNYVPIANHIPPAKPAREYKFALDPFQQVSVHAIQRNESVLVSAHTSAGKTVVAEYAIAQCLENKQRVIYTSPIKVRTPVFHLLHAC